MNKIIYGIPNEEELLSPPEGVVFAGDVIVGHEKTHYCEGCGSSLLRSFRPKSGFCFHELPAQHLKTIDLFILQTRQLADYSADFCGKKPSYSIDGIVDYGEWEEQIYWDNTEWVEDSDNPNSVVGRECLLDSLAENVTYGFANGDPNQLIEFHEKYGDPITAEATFYQVGGSGSFKVSVYTFLTGDQFIYVEDLPDCLDALGNICEAGKTDWEHAINCLRRTTIHKASAFGAKFNSDWVSNPTDFAIRPELAREYLREVATIWVGDNPIPGWLFLFV